jgi:hypothetical protein
MEISDSTLRKLSCFTSQVQNLSIALDLKQAIDEGKPIFVVLVDKGSRLGTIGRLRRINYRIESRGVLFFGTTQYAFEVEVDGRDLMHLGTGQFAWLQGYDGPTLWKFTRKPKTPAVKLIDKAGVELNVGDTVVAADDDTLYLGRLERRSDKGTIWIKEIQMRPDEVMLDEPMKFMSVKPDRVLKLSAAMLDAVLLAKLTY